MAIFGTHTEKIMYSEWKREDEIIERHNSSFCYKDTRLTEQDTNQFKKHKPFFRGKSAREAERKFSYHKREEAYRIDYYDTFLGFKIYKESIHYFWTSVYVKGVFDSGDGPVATTRARGYCEWAFGSF